MASTAELIAALGRNGDTKVAHVTPGELIIPEKMLDGDLLDMIADAFETSGRDISRFTVGENGNSTNPFTGFKEFFDDGSGTASEDDANDDGSTSAAESSAGSGSDGGSIGGADFGESTASEADADDSGDTSAAEAAAAEGFGAASNDIANFAIEFSPISNPQGIQNDLDNAMATVGGPLGQSLVSIDTPLGRVDISPMDVVSAIVTAPLGPVGTAMALGIHGLEALGMEGVTESADSAVAGQEASAADAGAGDAGEGNIAQTPAQQVANQFASASSDGDDNDEIGNQIIEFFKEFLERDVFDFNFADMPEFKILSDDFGSLKGINFAFRDLEKFNFDDFNFDPTQGITR